MAEDELNYIEHKRQTVSQENSMPETGNGKEKAQAKHITTNKQSKQETMTDQEEETLAYYLAMGLTMSKAI